MTTIIRRFTSEHGEVSVSVGDEMPDSDAVCCTCRWRGAHGPKCADGDSPWPTIKTQVGWVFVAVIRSEPRSGTTNLLTVQEARELLSALAEALPPATTVHQPRKAITKRPSPRTSDAERAAGSEAQRNLAWMQGRTDYINAKDVNRHKEGQEGYAEWQAGWGLMKSVADQFPKGERCHAQRDGECSWHLCPQLRDGESAKTGRHCPLDRQDEEEF